MKNALMVILIVIFSTSLFFSCASKSKKATDKEQVSSTEAQPQLTTPPPQPQVAIAPPQPQVTASSPQPQVVASETQPLLGPKKVVVPTGTRIDAKVVEDIDPKTSKVGDRLLFIADKDVVVGNYVVIARGARIMAEVAESKEKGYAGQAGRILISFRTASAVDGSEIIVSGSSRREGDDKMVESIGLGLVCCPLFLLMKGEEGIINAGQIVPVYTIQKAEVTVIE